VSLHHALMQTYHHPMRVCDSADFDGTNDSMARGAGLTGAADSKTGILSCWLRFDGGDGSIQRIVEASTGGTAFLLLKNASNILSLGADNAAGSEILLLQSTTAYTAGATWRHFLASWDLANGAGHLYISDANDLNTGTDVLTDDTIDYTLSDWLIPSSSFRLNGCCAEFYLAPGQYLDFSLVHNRRKFISASGKPVHLGTDGSLPTGTAPLVYLHLDDGEAVANFATNRGTGGNFSITGTLETGSSSPSD
jgi:hypothetical protein